jgi:hypothetical protein
MLACLQGIWADQPGKAASRGVLIRVSAGWKPGKVPTMTRNLRLYLDLTEEKIAAIPAAGRAEISRFEVLNGGLQGPGGGRTRDHR